MDYEDIQSVLQDVLELLNLGGEDSAKKATIIISHTISLVQLSSVAYHGFKELKELSGFSDMSQAELQNKFLKNDERVKKALDRIRALE